MLWCVRSDQLTQCNFGIFRLIAALQRKADDRTGCFITQLPTEIIKANSGCGLAIDGHDHVAILDAGFVRRCALHTSMTLKPFGSSLNHIPA